MTLVQLTEITHGDPRPLAVNPDHVMSLRPRKTITPVDAQQDPRGQVSYNGTIVEFATGEQHFVTEDFDTVHTLMAEPTPDPPAVPAHTIEPKTVPAGAVGTPYAPAPPPVKKSHHKQPPKSSPPPTTSTGVGPAQAQGSSPSFATLKDTLLPKATSSVPPPADE